MEIGIGILAFLVYIIFVMAWYLLLKRSIAEAMLLGLIIVCAFNGVGTLPQTFAASLTKALKQDVMAAIILFTVMASIMTQTGIITRLVNILNSILGRFRGGPAYVSACASAMFGMVSGASSANAATVGSITIPWMTESGWPKEVAATMNTGNAGLGICIPPSSSMFLMLGLPVVAGAVTAGDLYIALMCGGLWTLAYRLLLTRYYVGRYKIPAVPKDKIVSLGTAVKNGGSSLTMFLGILMGMPMVLLPVQLLLVNLVTDGLPAIALGLEPPERGNMEKPPRRPEESFFSGGLLGTILLRGVLIGLSTLACFSLLLHMGCGVAGARTGALTTLVLSQLLHVFECKSEQKNIFTVPYLNNGKLVLAVLASLLCLFGAIYVPALQTVFSTVALSGAALLRAVGLSLAVPLVAALIPKGR